MGFISDIGSKIGGVFGLGQGANTYRSTAPNIDFSAIPGAQSNYGGTIDQAAANAFAANAAANQARGSQGSFIQALQDRMAGNGPSVAEQLLKQQTQQNVAQAAGQMASARGLNPGLAARLVAQNQAATQQGAAGQGATLRAQEMLSNTGLLGQALDTQRGQDISQMGAAGSLYGTAGGLQNQQNQGLLGVQQLNQQTAAQNAANNLESQRINAGVAAQNADISSKAWAGLINAAGGSALQSASGGSGASAAGMAGGGEVPYYLSDPATAGAAPYYLANPDPMGADIDVANLRVETPTQAKPKAPLPPLTGSLATAPSNIPSILRLTRPLDYAGIQPIDLGGSGGSGFPSLAKAVGPKLASAAPELLAAAARGGAIPGRALVRGNSPANDIVPTMLSPGEIVLPRTVTEARNAPVKAERFVQALRRHRSAPTGYAAVLAQRRKRMAGGV